MSSADLKKFKLKIINDLKLRDNLLPINQTQQKKFIPMIDFLEYERALNRFSQQTTLQKPDGQIVKKPLDKPSDNKSNNEYSNALKLLSAIYFYTSMVETEDKKIDENHANKLGDIKSKKINTGKYILEFETIYHKKISDISDIPLEKKIKIREYYKQFIIGVLLKDYPELKDKFLNAIKIKKVKATITKPDKKE